MTGDLHVTAESLRAEFDAAFAERMRSSPELTALLTVRIAGAPYAMRLLEAGGLAALRQVVPVPSRRPDLLGVAGLRGEVLPIYSLARLVLRADDLAPPRWMILAGGAERVGLAFAAFDGHLVVPAAELRPVDGGEEHVASIHPGPPARPVLAVASLVAAIRAR